MNHKFFFDSLEQIRTQLVNQEVNETDNSIGSNIFILFGNDIEVSPSGRKSFSRKEWIIWVSDASWRLSKDEIYMVGSFDDPMFIQANIDNLLGKRLQSFHFLSQFLDLELNFEDGYQLTTFFNWREDNQWTILLPYLANGIRIDCSSEEEIKKVQSLASHCTIKESYKKIDFPLQEIAIKKISFNYNNYNLPTFICENNISVKLESGTWRLEKDNDYYIGDLDQDKSEIQDKLSEIIGKKIKQIDIANSMMDARFQIGDQYVLKTFSCIRTINHWKICLKNKPIFSAKIQLPD